MASMTPADKTLVWLTVNATVLVLGLASIIAWSCRPPVPSQSQEQQCGDGESTSAEP